MIPKFFGKKKTLDRISLGDLKMMRVELDGKIASLKTEIHSVEEKSETALYNGKSAQTEDELKYSAREITNLVETKKELLKKLTLSQNKRLAVERIIQIKEDEISILGKKNDILNEIDIAALSSAREEKEIRSQIEKMKIDEILGESESEGDYERILEILKSVNYDGESIDIAKTEIESLSSWQIL